MFGRKTQIPIRQLTAVHDDGDGESYLRSLPATLWCEENRRSRLRARS
jgi:hypothetical protein